MCSQRNFIYSIEAPATKNKIPLVSVPKSKQPKKTPHINIFGFLHRHKMFYTIGSEYHRFVTGITNEPRFLLIASFLGSGRFVIATLVLCYLLRAETQLVHSDGERKPESDASPPFSRVSNRAVAITDAVLVSIP